MIHGLDQARVNFALGFVVDVIFSKRKDNNRSDFLENSEQRIVCFGKSEPSSCVFPSISDTSFIVLAYSLSSSNFVMARSV